MKQAKKWMMLGVMMALLAWLVPSPALAYGWTPYGVCVALGILAAVLLAMYLRRQEIRQILAETGRSHECEAAAIGIIGRVDTLQLALCVVPAALCCARLSYCLIRFSFYFLEMGPASVLKIWEGGFLLYGAVLGALSAAVLLARHKRAAVAATLDELAAPGLVAVAIARLGEWTTGEGVGAWIESEALMRFPIAVMNEYEEWQLAVFLYEAAVALILLLPVLRECIGEGRRMETALLLFACCQIVLESLRMDSCLKIGFVRVSQVASAMLILVVTLLRARRHGGKPLMVRRFVYLLLCVAAVGGIEWALDKTPVSNVLLYLVMIMACILMMINATWFAKRERE